MDTYKNNNNNHRKRWQIKIMGVPKLLPVSERRERTQVDHEKKVIKFSFLREFLKKFRVGEFSSYLSASHPSTFKQF